MKLVFNKRLLSILAGIVMLVSATAVFAASVPWQSYSNSAFNSAKSQHKLVLVYVKANGCHWCALMNSESFSDPNTIRVITSKFIPVSVDIVTEKAIADKYNAYGTPTFIILDGDRHEVSRETGYESSNAFVAYLESL